MTQFTLAALELGPVQFDRPWWLLAWVPLAIAVVLIGRKSLSGLGSGSRRFALALRLLVLLGLVGVLAEPAGRRVSEDVAVTAVLDISRSIDPADRQAMESYIESARRSNTRTEDRLGVVTVGEDAIVQALPSPLATGRERPFVQDAVGTNLAAGVRLALAAMPNDAANRLVVISDGNETEDSVRAAAESARAAGVPIDVLPVRFAYPREVIAERLIAPGTARGGEPIGLRVVLRATAPATGRLNLLLNDQPVDLDPDSDQLGIPVELTTGTNVFQIPITPNSPGAQNFTAVFEPTPDASGVVADSLGENNQAQAVTFVSSEGWVLLIAEDDAAAPPLARSLREAGLQVDIMPAANAPTDLTGFNNYEAVVLVNQPERNFSPAAQEDLRRFVHDTGGGLVVVGGPDSFGAGGWIGSPLEDALPVRLDPPSKRQLPRGALVLVMHSVEMPRGQYWARETALAAASGLTRLDLVGMVEYQTFAGVDWVYPLVEKGDGSEFQRAVNNLTFGDMPDFDPSLRLALAGLQNVNAGQRHTIIISDGDPTLSRSVLREFKAAGISISTVGVFPHSPGDFNTLRLMARETGGTFYPVDTQAALATLPEIFFQEAQIVSRPLIWEGDPFAPAIVNRTVESMRGIRSVPPVSGYVVAAERAGLAVVTLRGQDEDPLSAQWQYGLGKVVAFTSDSATRWSPAWVSWQGYRAFWEQHVRWAMRPGGSANVRVTTERDGDRTAVLVDVFDQDGERVSFADIRGRVAGPSGGGEEIALQPVGPGRYRAMIETQDAGAYVMGLRYRLPGEEGAPDTEGTVRAAVTRPFADEFRALEDNAALLEQIAQATGGRVLDGGPDTDDLWRRDGLDMPVATRSVWLAVALASIGLFLADVGVRRVRIDLGAIRRAAGRSVRRDAGAAAADVGSLRAARAKARERMGEGAEVEQAERASERIERFEAEAGEGRGGLGLETDQSDAPAKIVREASAPGSDSDEGEGLGRLFDAKRRAREELDKQSEQDQ